MKLRGVVRGQTIELETSTGLPDGQCVQVELEIAASQTTAGTKADQDLETRIATDPAFEDIRQARALSAYPNNPAALRAIRAQAK